ncbi:MAG TPA: S-adenosylmethionine decarboxylase [Blastocatellia bacterium]|nr:S-adenosylmethionine decarboxylase [Blastocatellia bacterium]
MNVGTEWFVDAAGCSEGLLGDELTIRRVCERIITDLDLHVVGEGLFHTFPPPAGVTGLFLLTESHLACHTYPEIGLATFNLYCCNPRPEWPWRERLANMLGAQTVIVQRVMRGAAGDADELVFEAAAIEARALAGEERR